MTGRTLGDFTVQEKLDAGAQAAVYRAEQRGLGREAVVKVLFRGAGVGERGVQRFLREAQLASRLDHPYAAHIYAFGAEPDGVLWIAMERVRGTPLSVVLAAQPERRMTVARLVPLLDRVCEVVHSAHEQGIVHRDLKPDNIMVLARAGRMLPKLLDFGVAKLVDEHEAPAVEAGGSDDGDARLTQHGARVGTPLYMAPEQWTDGEIDARTDLYALGVIAFEALAGRVPFTGRGLAEIARAHVNAPLPALPDDVPPAIADVLRRACAKQREDRPASALVLAAELRAAAGMSLGADAIPRLDESLRADIGWLPQPIAEAIARFEGARNPHMARDALWEIVGVAARWLGVIALCARSRGGDRGGDAPAVVEALRELHRRELTDEEWIDLVRALVRPHGAARDAHPVPELVELGLAEPSPFAPLFALRAAEATSSTSEETLRDRLAHALPLLADLLRAIAVFGGYQIVVRKGDRVEVWMGKSRAPRPLLAATAGLVEGVPALADLEGRPLLSLAPLVAIAAPSPGAPDELFLFAGPGRVRGRGARLVAEPNGFERHDDAVWAWFRDHLLAGDDGAAAPVEDAPYRGLAAFTADDAQRFFGRERAAEAFLNQLLVTPLLAVVGPSGAGKSSFVQAGVLPALPAGWRSVMLRPGAAPMAAFAARVDLDRLDRLDRLDAPRSPGDVLVIVVDQLEELFTLCRDPEQRIRFADVLAAAAHSADAPTRVILTVRDDFLARAGELPALRDRIAQGVTLLANPAPDDLVRILVEPARRAGYDFDDKDLPARMVRSVAGQPGALALLSFTASRLWELRDRHFKRLTRSSYEAIGGVEGALAAHADAVMDAASADEQRLIRDAFRHLVTAEGTRAVLSRRELDDVLGKSPHAAAVVERLVAARLLVASESDTGEDRIEIIHEALVAGWPRLAGWRRDDAEGARLRDQLRAAARQWADRGRARGLLWRDDALDDYRRWRARWPGALPELDEAFAAASLRDAARGRRVRRTLAAVAATVLVAGVVALSLLYRSSQHNAQDARDRVVQSYVEQGRRLLLDGDYLRALPYLSAAYSAGDESTALRFMLHRAMKLADMPMFPEHKASLGAFRGDDQMLIVNEDGGAIVWEISAHRVVAELPPPPRTAESTFAVGAVAKDGSVAAIARPDAVALWDGKEARSIPLANVSMLAINADATQVAAVAPTELAVYDARTRSRLWSAPLAGTANQLFWTGDAVAARYSDTQAYLASSSGVVAFGATIRILPPIRDRFATFSKAGIDVRDPHGALLAHLAISGLGGGAMSPDGAMIAVSSFDGLVALFDVASGERVGTLVGSPNVGSRPYFSPDGRRIITSGDDGAARVWDVDNRSELLRVASPGAVTSSVAFDRSGRRAMVAGPGGVSVFPLVDPSALVVIDAGEAIGASAFSVDGTRVFTSSDTGIELWDAATGALAKRLTFAFNDGAHLSPDGRLAALPLTDGNAAEIVDMTTGAVRARLPSSATVYYAIFDHAGTHVLTAADAGALDLWDLDGKHLHSLRGHSGTIYAATFSPDDRCVVSAGYDDRTARVWDVATGRALGSVSSSAGLLTAVFDGSGDRFLTAGEDHMARLWDARTFMPIRSLRHLASLRGATISRDGVLVAGAGRDATTILWDVATGQELTRFRHGAGAMSVDFDAGHRRLFAGGLDHRGVIWDVGVDVPPPGEVETFSHCHSPFALRETRLDAVEVTDCPWQRRAKE